MSEHDKVNILMVDDQPAKLLSYEVILTELGENLIKAGSGREALEHLLKIDIAVVLMDVSMPELDGFELAEIIHQHPRYQKTAIIFISAVHLTDLDRLKGYERGAVDYISVPVIPELLRAKVSLFAELYRKTQQLEQLNRELEQRVAERTAELEASTVRLRESEESFRAIFENAGIGMSVLSHDSRFLKVNTTMQEMFGYSAAETDNMEMASWTYPDDVLIDVDLFREVFAGRLERYQVEKRYLRKDGRLLWGRFTATSIKDAHGQPHFVIGMLEDITERRRAEEELQKRADALQRLNTELEYSNRELDAFAYIASHDLKEPLRGIHHFSHFLLEDYSDKLDADGVSKLSTLMRLTQRMESLLESILHYSHVGRAELAMEDTDMQSVVEETLELLGVRLQENQVEVRIPARLPSVQADRVRVGEIFNNLIANAIKYNDKSDKWIEIGCEWCADEERGKQLAFYVRDNGIGIATQHHEAVFRIFRRLHGRDEYGGGTGAGLTIVRKIVERHGGRIWLASRPGAGSTFYFTLGTSRERTHPTNAFHSAS
ncbi:MAG: ATP-binding protein [Candidatus Tectimicrobiota bacterium]